MSDRRPPQARLDAATKALTEHGGSVTEAAKAIGCARTTLSTWLSNGWVGARPGSPEPEGKPEVAPVEHAEPELQPKERLALKDRIRALESELKAERRKAVTEDEVQREILGLSSATLSAPEWVAPQSAGFSGPGIPALVISDVHWNEVVAAEETNGINAYSPVIQARRLQRAIDSTIELCFDHLKVPSYPGIVVMLGGDMVSGDIHDELVETNAAESIPTVLDLASHLRVGLTRLADRFGRVFATTAFGNHGRQNKQYRFKRHAYQSYDWLLYNIVARSFQDAGDDRVRFVIPTGPDSLFQIAGRRYLLTHGDNLGTRGGDGIIGALGPIRRGSIKVGAQYDSLGLHFDTLVLGHYHQLIQLDDVIVNGCGIGYNDYARYQRFRPEIPRYALWTTHPRHGITWSFPVNLEDPKSLTANPEWVSWSEAS